MNGIRVRLGLGDGGWRTAWRTVFFAGWLSLGPSGVAANLSVEVGVIQLEPNASDQAVELFVRNHDAVAFRAQGMTLRLQLGDGLGGAGTPAITSVDAVAGTAWDGPAGWTSSVVQQPGYWDVRVLANLAANQYAELGPGSLTRLALLRVDTTGINSGNWSFKLAGLTAFPGGSKYNSVETADEVFPSVVNGSLKIATPPTAARLDYFRAVRAGDGTITLAWRTLVETGTLGFWIERRAGDAGWVRVNAGLLPTAFQARPWEYSLIDRATSAAGADRYRLLAVDSRGDAHVLAEAVVVAGFELRLVRSAAELALDLTGEPGTLLTVEASEAVSGPWRPATRLTLDHQGRQRLALGSPHAARARFFRVVCP